jgi:hypothetical protein
MPARKLEELSPAQLARMVRSLRRRIKALEQEAGPAQTAPVPAPAPAPSAVLVEPYYYDERILLRAWADEIARIAEEVVEEMHTLRECGTPFDLEAEIAEGVTRLIARTEPAHVCPPAVHALWLELSGPHGSNQAAQMIGRAVSRAI